MKKNQANWQLHFRILGFTLGILLVSSVSYSLENQCVTLFKPSPANESIARQNSLGSPRSPVNFEEIHTRIKKITDQKETMVKDHEFHEEVLTFYYSEITKYAAELIRSHRNADFLYLASQVDFPINKSSDGFISVGRYLLVDVILSKNYEIYHKLFTLARENKSKFDGLPQIGKWSQQLTRIFLEDPVFSKDVLVIKDQSGRGPELKVAEYGLLTPSRLESFERIAETKSLSQLHKTLVDIFPYGFLFVTLKTKKGEVIPANLQWEYNHDDKENQWLHTKLDGLQFNFYTKKHVALNGDFYSGEYKDLLNKEENWIKEISVTDKFVKILIERDKDGMFYDRGSRYQELTLSYDSTNRITNFEIRNGSSLLTRWIWSSSKTQLEKNTRGEGPVSIRDGFSEQHVEGIQN